SEPVKIANAEKYELSYDKRASVMGAQNNAIAETIGDWFFYYWAATTLAQMARTTGVTAPATTGTGVRTILMLADIQKMQKLFNKQNIPQMDRFAQLDADMYDQLLNQLNATTYRDFSASVNAEAGVVGKLYGFTFLAPRSTVLVYDNSATPIPYDPSQTPVAATANAAGLFWHKDSVIRALGQNDFFENLNDPTYYGDIYSTLVRAGGRVRRNDGCGVAALVQA
ncbi:MAG: phage capsid protein, partial [Methylobacter sp.]|nr:phage capsid protein [Methylobacter sp.]